jgi:adenine-specific DNA methylase
MEKNKITLKLIESDFFPVDILSRDAAIEMSFKPRPSYFARCKELNIPAPKDFYDPKVRSLHPWLARRPRSIARALNLASLLTSKDSNNFLNLLGFSADKLKSLVKNGYPPLISYTTPETDSLKMNFENEIIMDPMAGGGSIPLEAAILGCNTIVCEYNPVAFLILKATIEFPAKYGRELYLNVKSEAEKLINYALEKLSPFYDKEAEGYIILRQVNLNNKIYPIATSIPLTPQSFVSIEGDKVKIVKGKASLNTNRKLLSTWIQQYCNALENNNIELLDILNKCITVQTEKGFRLGDEFDQELLRKSFEEYCKIKSALPETQLPRDNEVFYDLLPLRKYNHLFNPRQALALGLLVDYIHKRIKELINDKGEFGAAIGLYLALGIDRLADFNSIITTWNANQATIRDSIGSYYKFRKFRLEGIYTEAIVPFRTLEWIFEPNAKEKTAGGICPILRELCEKLEGKGNKVKVYLCNAMELSRYFKEKISVINVDPPYYDQHIYSDFSEFFWPLLKLTLNNTLELLFKENYLSSWSPRSWRVPREDEIVSRKPSDRTFEVKLKKALIEMRKVLDDDGLLLLWFSHRKLEAWKAVLKALKDAEFKLTNIIPLVSEHPTRSITKGGKLGISHVLILVARKSNTPIYIDKAKLRNRVIEWAKRAKIYPSEEIKYEELEVIKTAIDLALQFEEEIKLKE